MVENGLRQFSLKNNTKQKSKKKKYIRKKIHKNKNGIRNFFWFTIVQYDKTYTHTKMRPRMLLTSILLAKK